MAWTPLKLFNSRLDPPFPNLQYPFQPSPTPSNQAPSYPNPHFRYTTIFKNPLRKNKRRNPETVVISTFEDLLRFFDDSKRRAKEKSQVKVDFDNIFDDSDDADAGISHDADDGADDNDDAELMVRGHDSGYRSDSADNVS